MSTIVLTGRAGADPDLRFTDGQKPFATLRVAEDRSRQNDAGIWVTTHTDWHDVTIYGDRAKQVVEQVRRGDLVLVVGDLSSREVERDGHKRTYWRINAREIGLVRPKGGSHGDGAAGESWATRSTTQAAAASWADTPDEPAF